MVMRKSKGIVILLCLFSSSLFAQQKSALELEMNYLKVWSNANSKLAANLLHPDYHYIGADGERHTRQWTLDMIGSGRLVYNKVEIERGPVHRIGDMIISLGTLQAPGTWDGRAMVDHLAFTMVWTQVDGKWLLLSEQNSRVRKPKPATK